MHMHIHTHTIYTNWSFLVLFQADGTEVTCQVASPQKSVTCSVGYPALKKSQQVQSHFILSSMPAPSRHSCSCTTYPLPSETPSDRHHRITGCILRGYLEEAYKYLNIFFTLLTEVVVVSPGIPKAHTMWKVLISWICGPTLVKVLYTQSQVSVVYPGMQASHQYNTFKLRQVHVPAMGWHVCSWKWSLLILKVRHAKEGEQRFESLR